MNRDSDKGKQETSAVHCTHRREGNQGGGAKWGEKEAGEDTGSKTTKGRNTQRY